MYIIKQPHAKISNKIKKHICTHTQRLQRLSIQPNSILIAQSQRYNTIKTIEIHKVTNKQVSTAFLLNNLHLKTRY